MVQSVPPGLEGLVDLACRDGVDIRPTLLRVLTDLYVQKPSHTPEEETHYVELAQRLFNTVDASTKAAVATRLMNYGQVPQALARHIEIRAILPEAQVAEAHVREAQVREAQVPGAHVPEAPTAPAAPEQSLANRAAELTEIFFAAEPQERRAILLHLDAVAAQNPAPVRKAGDIVRHLETSALRHDVGAFSREIVGALGISREIADRIIQDPTGEPLLLIGRMFDMPAAMLQRVLLFLNPNIGQSVQRVYELAALYGDISRPAAAHLLSIFRLSAPPAHPAYQDVLYQSTLWNDEDLNARETATPHRSHHAASGAAHVVDTSRPQKSGTR